MKKAVVFALCILSVFTLSSCAAADKETVARILEADKETIIEAIETENFSKAKMIPGIMDINVGTGYVSFQCGTKGFGSSTSYYGFSYSPDGNFNSSIGGNISKEECIINGPGYLWKEPHGDNEFYFEELGDGFIYYELHF